MIVWCLIVLRWISATNCGWILDVSRGRQEAIESSFNGCLEKLSLVVCKYCLWLFGNIVHTITCWTYIVHGIRSCLSQNLYISYQNASQFGEVKLNFQINLYKNCPKPVNCGMWRLIAIVLNLIYVFLIHLISRHVFARGVERLCDSFSLNNQNPTNK